MAITNNGTKVNIQASQVPTGFTYPTVTTFTDYEYKREFVFDVLRSTVSVADKATTLSNILNNATIGINKQVTDAVTADFIGTNDVQIYAEMTKLNHNIFPTSDTDFLGSAAVVYKCTVTVYTKTV